MKQIRTVSIVAIITIAALCIGILIYFTIKDTNTSITIIHNSYSAPAVSITDTVEISTIVDHYEFDTLWCYPEWDFISSEFVPFDEIEDAKASDIRYVY